MKTLDLTKPVQLFNGTKARIVCTDVDSGRPDENILVLARTGAYGRERAVLYHKSGLHFGETIYGGEMEFRVHPFDLVNVEEDDG